MGNSLELIAGLPDESIDLVMTSPPFALQRQKEYGNESQKDYINWISQFGELLINKLTATGSLVIDLGGAYQKGKPVRSLYNYRVLLHFCDVLGYHLAEEFFWFNPSKLPSPIEWVNKRKIRAKDAVNTVWWLSKTEWPKANVSNVLVEYSDRMKKLLKNPGKYYTPNSRPSGHEISDRFANDNGGAIPPNLLKIPNSESGSSYLKTCKSLNIKRHPARFPAKLPEFFIRFLTDPDDLVLDVFAGSNTTGYVAEQQGRRWLSFDMEQQYVAASAFRFVEQEVAMIELQSIYNRICAGKTENLTDYQYQRLL